jgi:hypothetical protein
MLNIGDELIIPIKAEHHLKKTGVKCQIRELHKQTVYVVKFNDKTEQYNKNKICLDRFFVEKLKKNTLQG